MWGYLLPFPSCSFISSFLLFSTALVKRTFGEVVVTSVLMETPLEIIILTMMDNGFILTLYDIDVLARVNEILLPINRCSYTFYCTILFSKFHLEFIVTRLAQS